MTAAYEPADLLAGLLTGIGEADPDLAEALDGPDLLEICGQLAHLLWTPLMLERWGCHPRWAGVHPEVLLTVLRGLGLPPEAPRSAVPAPQNVCPEHRVRLQGGTCSVCDERKTPGPPPEWRRRGDTAPGGIRIGGES